MPSDESRSEIARRAARTRASCPNCRNSDVIERDGSQVGGLPGIVYRCCDGCGWTQAKTTRPRREKI